MNFRTYLNESAKTLSDKDLQELAKRTNGDTGRDFKIAVSKNKSDKKLIGDFTVIEVDTDGGFEPTFKTEDGKTLNLNDIVFNLKGR